MPRRAGDDSDSLGGMTGLYSVEIARQVPHDPEQRAPGSRIRRWIREEFLIPFERAVHADLAGKDAILNLFKPALYFLGKVPENVHL